MTPPRHPPVNGRNLAEYYVASEASKLSTLREYAKPPDEQQARILMYDPIRKFVREYFKSGRDEQVPPSVGLPQIEALLECRL